jgi:hypothetical protein
MTKTAAYNANEVAAVYMSLNRDDLLSTDEGGSRLSSDTTLRNGFYGLSDPFNLRGMLESFEVDFSQSSGKQSYRIRILNPTSELEVLLLGFYDEVFPSTMSTFKQFKTAAEQEARMLDVVGDLDKELLANDSPPALPSIYLRFGYGTEADTGLSRIHKAKIFDIKYYVSDKEDRVIELHAVDLFSYSKQNPDFNRRPYIARVPVSDEVDGQLSLRKPSEILTEIFALYTSTYPECVPIVDLGSYTDSIDNLVYSVAKALGESDAISDRNAALKEEGLEVTESDVVTAEGLTEEEVKAFEDLLDRPLITAKNIDRGVDGTVTPQILYQAFKMVFESIGLKWEMNPVGAPEPVTGVLSPNQTTGSNVDPGKGLEDEANSASNINNLKVNIQTEWLEPSFEPKYTKVQSTDPELDGQKRLSFWPMGLKRTYATSARVIGTGEQIRPLTTEEKAAHPEWRIWLNAGMVNPQNTEDFPGFALADPEEFSPDDSFKFSFTVEKLQSYFFAESVIDAKNALALGTGDSSLQPIPVSFPIVVYPAHTQQSAFSTVPLFGEQNNVVGPSVAGTFTGELAPLIDVESGMWQPYAYWETFPESPIQDWAWYANEVYQNSYRFDPLPLHKLAINPLLVNLEPTAETALWILLNIQNYDENKQKQQEDLRKGLEELAKSAKKTFSGITQFISERPKPGEATRFRKFIDRFSNAYVSMGDDGENPHISAFLQSILNNLNRLLIGKSSKMRVVQVQVNALTPADKKNLQENSALFNGITWEETWANNNNCLLLLMPGDSIISQYSDSVIRPILSFPQTNRGTGPKYCWLDYGTPDSIVANVEFTGDTRVLVNLAQSNYSVRQWNDVRQLFDGNETISNELISNTISNILADKIANIDDTQSVEAQLQQKEELQRLQKIAHNQSNMEINVELLELLPELLSSYQVDPKTGEDELSELEVVTENSALELRKLASLVSNPKILHTLYPDVYGVDGQTNNMTTPAIKVTANGIVREDKPVRLLRQRIDLDSMRSRISKVEQSRKITDVAYNYSVAMQQEAFTIKLTTLGIPEIDDPASEYLSRRICFKYYDPRLANGSLHWLSGVYQLTGFKHRLNPSQGFLTELEMVRLPNESLTNLKEVT